MNEDKTNNSNLVKRIKIQQMRWLGHDVCVEGMLQQKAPSIRDPSVKIGSKGAHASNGRTKCMSALGMYK